MFCCRDDPSELTSFLRSAVGVVNDILEDQENKNTENGQRRSGSSSADTAAFAKQAAGIVSEIFIKNKSGSISRASDVEFDDGSNIPLSTCDGNKKSLFIGINYFGSRAELRGCINDVQNIKRFVTQEFGFPTDSSHMMTLTDDGRGDGQPTRANMINAFKWLVQGARSGDSLFVHYSGHGGSQADEDGDEVDGMDETLIPVDYEKSGVIVDDLIHEILVASLPQGVRLTAIMDCCHSGSVFDLPYTYTPDGNLEIQEVDNRKAALEAALAAGMSLFNGDKRSAAMAGLKAIKLYLDDSDPAKNKEAQKKQIQIRSTVADVIQFSGCRDEQTSADANIGGQATGAMSWSFIEAYKQGGRNQNYLQLLGNIRQLLYGKYTQVPQMSTGHRMDMSVKFKM